MGTWSMIRRSFFEQQPELRCSRQKSLSAYFSSCCTQSWTCQLVGEPVGNLLGARWEPKKPFVLDCPEGVRILGEMKVFLDEMFKWSHLESIQKALPYNIVLIYYIFMYSVFRNRVRISSRQNSTRLRFMYIHSQDLFLLIKIRLLFYFSLFCCVKNAFSNPLWMSCRRPSKLLRSERKPIKTEFLRRLRKKNDSCIYHNHPSS